MAANIPNFKCIIIGDPFTGKTKFIQHFSSGIGQEIKDSNSDSHFLMFSTNFGSIAFTIYDPNGEEASGNVRDSFFKNSDCALIFFDITSASSYESVFHWYRRVTSINGKIPIALCGNNAHAMSRKVQYDKAKLDWEPRMRYFEISSREESSINKPFDFLAKKLLKKGTILNIAQTSNETFIDAKSLLKLIETEEETAKEAEEVGKQPRELVFFPNLADKTVLE